MNLFALALLVCNLKTGQCHWHVAALYKSQADCDNAAMVFVRRPAKNVEVIDCRPTTPPPRRK